MAFEIVLRVKCNEKSLKHQNFAPTLPGAWVDRDDEILKC